MNNNMPTTSLYRTLIKIPNLSKQKILSLANKKCEHNHSILEHPCLTKNNKILMEDFSWKNIDAIQENDYILSMDKNKNESTNRFTRVKVLKTMQREVDNYLELTFNNGIKLEITENHPIYRIFTKAHGKGRLGRSKWMKAINMFNKPTLYFPKNDRNNYDWKKGWIISSILGDGNLFAPLNRIVFTNTKIILIEKFQELFEEIFKYKGKIVIQNNKNKPEHHKDVYWVKIQNKELFKCISDLKDDILKNVENYSEDFYRGFLAGFHDSEGCNNIQYEKGIYIKNRIFISNTNKDYIKLLENMLKKLNIKYSTEEEDRSNINQKNIFRLNLLDRIRFLLTCLPYTRNNTNLGCYHRALENVYVINMKLINKKVTVYNLETESHNYIAEGILVHNCCLQKYLELPQERVGFLDIESSNLKGNWGIVLTYCIKEAGGDIIYNTITKEDIDNKLWDYNVIKNLCEDIKKFDRVIGYYSTKFDLPFVRTRAQKHNLNFPVFREVLHTDLYYMIKNKFSLHSNRLQVACEFFNIASKEHPILPEVFMSALTGDKDAIDYVLTHNKEDVISTELLYNKVMSFSGIYNKSI